jgi:hypothetical protein
MSVPTKDAPAVGGASAPKRSRRVVGNLLTPAHLRMIVSVIVVAALWQIVGSYLIKSGLVFASLTSIFTRAFELAQTGKLWTNIEAGVFILAGTSMLLMTLMSRPGAPEGLAAD